MIYFSDEKNSVVAKNEKEVYSAARSSASLTKSLEGIDVSNVEIALPGVHDLRTVYEQFEDTISKAGIMRLLRSTHLISELRERKTLINFFDTFDQAPLIPGKFFSDMGEMIRTVACTVDENSIAWEQIGIKSGNYLAIICGYLDGIGPSLTIQEKENIHYSGLLMIYMQAIRFVTDFLNNDVFYPTDYPEQNLNRALNQYILLEQLEEFLQTKYHFKATV